MECFGAFIVIVIGIVTLSVAVSAFNARSRGWNNAYRVLAKKYGGQWFGSGLFGTPSARFQYGETYCTLTNIRTHARQGGAFTQLAIQWPDSTFRVEVFPEWRKSKLWPFSGMKDFELSDRQFATRYVVRTNDGENAENLFSPGFRWQVDRLRAFMKHDDIYISLNRGLLTIKKPTYIKGQIPLDDFVRYCLELFDQAMLTRTVGISFVEEDKTQVLDEVLCQICGDKIQLDMVFCVRCKTPHCLECWEYYGQCSTFACGETRYVTPKIASRVNATEDGE